MSELKFVVFGPRLVLAYCNECTILYQRDENRWVKSPVDYLTFVLSEGMEYTELGETDIIEIYNEDIVQRAKAKIEEILAK